ncbi:MAG TPA: MBL fold metallo-hydrolase [Actinophytocola sp.]|uniref:MBL fold metallo-hydrolase n=1 Tax=Actinophytocola sp. TaxID=1872138 RepID=UPI002DBF5885|nr:MBL fold metallo-hydrolase [Actinophytocola sp.]HEU5471478.1 MBL fold metallo-hydrolase [Actinophytocola sp.]
MLLTVLGCSGSAPGPNAPTSGYLLEADGFQLGIEFGNGTLAALQAIRDPFLLDALLFSHLHPDHCADFSGLTVIRRYHPAPSRDPRVHRLPVYTPVEGPERFVAAHSPDAETEATTDLSDVYEFHTITPGTVHIGPFEITAIHAAHPCESFSFRISWGGRSLAYTGDTGVFEGLVDLATGVDVLLSEASWTHGFDRPTELHLSGTDAGQLAKRANAGRLLVTHIPPWTDSDAVIAEARAAYQGEVVRVRQGASYRI